MGGKGVLVLLNKAEPTGIQGCKNVSGVKGPLLKSPPHAERAELSLRRTRRSKLVRRCPLPNYLLFPFFFHPSYDRIQLISLLLLPLY